MSLQKLRVRALPPPLDAGAIPRPGVLERLARAADVTLTLIVAPPGFGKTTALGVWLANQATPACYLAIGPRDASFSGFMRALVDLFRHVLPDTGDALQHEIDAEPSLDGPGLAELAARTLEMIPHDVTLIFDDYHAIASDEVHAFFGELVRLAPPSLHLVIASRFDPPFPWARLRFVNRLTEVRAEHLRLDRAQSALALENAGAVDPDGELARIVWEETQGWPAGVRGASQALAALQASSVTDVAISDAIFNALHDFLVQEVFDRQPEPVRDALMRLALLPRFDTELAEVLIAPENAATNTSTRMLTELLTSGPYLDHDPTTGWATFHPLFRRFLLQQLIGHHPSWDRKRFQREAGLALAARGETDDGITLLTSAGDAEGAAHLIEQCLPPALGKQQWRLVEHWLSLLPSDTVLEHPWLLVGRIWTSHFSGRNTLLAVYVDRLRHLAERGHPDAAELLATCDLFEAMLQQRNHARIVELLQRAIPALSNRSAFAQGLAQYQLGVSLQSLGQAAEAQQGLTRWIQLHAETIDARFVLGLDGLMMVHHAEGNLVAAHLLAAELSAVARSHALLVALSWAERELGILAYQQNQLDEAEAHFQEVLAHRDASHVSCVADAMAGLACTQSAMGKQDDAQATLEQVLEFARERQVAEHMIWARSLSALLALAEAPPDVARALRLTEDVDPGMGYIFQIAFPPKVRVRALLYSGTPEHLAEAETALTLLEERAAREHYLPMQIIASAMRAVLQDQGGQHETALATLAATIRRGASDHVVRPFLDIEPLLRPLLQELASRRNDVEGMAELATALGAGYQSALTTLIPPSLKLLTIREAEVFELLMERLTYKEIAYQLSISPDTVKRHVNSIYSKLEVTGRREALLKASELGWHSA